MVEEVEQARGREARRPWQISVEGWRDIAFRIWAELAEGAVLDRAASIAFYGVLALYPALTGTVSIYGLLADTTDVVAQVNRFSAAMPPAAREVILQELTTIAETSETGLTLGFISSLLLAGFSASSGVAALMRGINDAYDEEETRGWIRRRLLALFFTFGVSSFVVVSVLSITLLPLVLLELGVGSTVRSLLQLLRWPALALATMLGLSFLYRYAANRTPARWEWVLPGSLLATVIWTIGSLSFSVYADNFGRFSSTYGALAGAVVLSLWMFLSATAILVGAELNAETEHQTRVDTTIGPLRPMGQRGAVMADELGEARPDTGPFSWRDTLRSALTDLYRKGRRKERALRRTRADDSPAALQNRASLEEPPGRARRSTRTSASRST